MPQPRIIIVGSANIDLVLRVPHIPRPGESVHGDGFMMVPGGKGANQAVGAAKLGTPTAMIARTGDDLFADLCFASFAQAGLDTTQIIRDPRASSGIALILVEQASGQNSIAVAPQANALLSPADVDAAAALLRQASILLTQQEVPLATTRHALRLARAAGLTTIHNPAPAFGPLDAELLALVDILTPNQDEAEKLSGIAVASEQDAVRAAARLQSLGVGSVVITLGKLGAYYATASEQAFVPGFSVTPLDTTAAGDAFNAALAVALAQGQPLRQAVRYANAAGALCVTKLGAQPALPTAAEVDRLLATQRE